MERAVSRPGQKSQTQGRERMTSHRGLITAATLAAVVTLAGTAPAQAGTLLSGYGGPGQGNQALIGATLINPPGGGGAGGGGESLARSGASPSSSSGQAASGPARGSAHRSRQLQQRHASAGAARAYSPALGSTASEPAVGSSTLGLSGVDFVYIVLVLGGLVAAGALTRRLADPAR
jgi:hypothetical protein